MPSGKEFITHEFDEAIAIQRAVVRSATVLATSHPVAAVRRQIKTALTMDKRHLASLEQFGKSWGAKGKVEEVAGALGTLAKDTSDTTENKTAEESDAYEAHAVLLNLKRKQQDSAEAVIRIARDLGDKELLNAASLMKREIKRGADALGKSLASFALRIASS